jgi:hypothetical protein
VNAQNAQIAMTIALIGIAPTSAPDGGSASAHP